MNKNYKNRAMKTGVGESEGEVYFFPKNNPPVAVRAHSKEEAEEKLSDINSKNK